MIWEEKRGTIGGDKVGVYMRMCAYERGPKSSLVPFQKQALNKAKTLEMCINYI